MNFKSIKTFISGLTWLAEIISKTIKNFLYSVEFKNNRNEMWIAKKKENQKFLNCVWPALRIRDTNYHTSRDEHWPNIKGFEERDLSYFRSKIFRSFPPFFPLFDGIRKVKALFLNWKISKFKGDLKGPIITYNKLGTQVEFGQSFPRVQ